MIADKSQLTTEEIQQTELAQLMDLARNIGSYEWAYKGDDNLHDGPVAQQLLKCEGLKDAVHKDLNGVLFVDTKYVAMACLGYIAALTRLITGEELNNDS